MNTKKLLNNLVVFFWIIVLIIVIIATYPRYHQNWIQSFEEVNTWVINTRLVYNINHQPIVKWTKEEVNNSMFRFFNKESIQVNLEDKTNITIITNKPVASNRNIFIGVNGKSLWAIYNNWDTTSNIYSYHLGSIPVVWFKWGLNLTKYITNSWLKLLFFVGQPDNYVKSFILE